MTIVDIARKTGYSVGTVSRVLNHQPNVSERARQAILACAEESGFEPNANARSLKQQYGRGILAVVKGTSNELFAHMVEQMQQHLSQTAYPLMLSYIDEDDNEAQCAQRLCREKKPLGLLILGGSSRNFTSCDIPVPAVFVTVSAQSQPHISSVTTDDRQAACCAVEYLLDMGHRLIGVIGGNRELSDTSRLRFEGCRDACLSRGLLVEDTLRYASARYSYKGGYTAMEQLLAQQEPLTAVFAVADVMAIGAMRALREAGLQVPQDVSLVGFDGIEIGAYVSPKLTTVEQQTDELARRSIEILLQQIEKPSPAIHESVAFRLCCRESVSKREGV